MNKKKAGERLRTLAWRKSTFREEALLKSWRNTEDTFLFAVSVNSINGSKAGSHSAFPTLTSASILIHPRLSELTSLMCPDGLYSPHSKWYPLFYFKTKQLSIRCGLQSCPYPLTLSSRQKQECIATVMFCYN